MKLTRLRRLLACSVAAASIGALTQASPASARANTAGEFIPLASPARILDTRKAIGIGTTTPVGQFASIDLQVTGRGGVPATGARAIVMNVTAVAPTASGYVSVYPAGTTRPTVSNLNFVPGQNVPNLVTVQLGADGRVSLYNHNGSTHLLADVIGYYDDTTVSGGWYHPLTPQRLLDTRTGNGAAAAPLGTGGSLTLQVSGRGGVPDAAQVAAVVLNVTAVEPTAAGFVTVWPGGGRPDVSNLNFTPGQTVPNLVIVAVSASGTISMFNETGNTHLIADVVGWYDRSGTAGGLVFTPIAPQRVMDTREFNSPVGEDQGPFHSPVAFLDTAEINNVRAVVMNITATETTSDGFFSVYPPTVAPPLYTPVPNTSNLNWRAGQTVPNAVMSSVSNGVAGVRNGDIIVYNKLGSAHLIIDTVGYFTVPAA